MQVVLLQNTTNIGLKGTIKDVKPGYARHYLIPRGIAVMPTPSLLEEIKAAAAKKVESAKKVATNAKEIAQKIKNLKISLTAKAVKGGKKLFGSVTEQDIADAIYEEIEVAVDAKTIKMESHIKEVGEYSFNVNLNDDITAKVHITVSAE